MAPVLVLFALASLWIVARALPVAEYLSGQTRPTTAAKRAKPLLRFNKQGTFQLAVFADLHYGENAWDSWGPQQDINSQKVMRTVLDAEKQDFVVLNGDLITGENGYKENASIYIDTIVKPLTERSIPWASTYGNHDSSFNLSRNDILAREQRYSGAYTTQMVTSKDAGVSNYYLTIWPSDGSTQKPALIMWFFDSRGGFYYQQRNSNGDLVGVPDWVDQSVVDWFKSTNQNMVQKWGVVPSLAFVHIPTNASQALQTGLKVDPHKQPGINDDYVLAQQAQGWCPNGVNDGTCAYGGQDTPFMQAITSTSGLMALFSGHDHGDTWCYKWSGTPPGMTINGNGVNLCFNQHSGYGGYGNWARGARQVLLTEKLIQQHVIDTWIRLETGDVVGKVTLNSTYGQDMYPATPNTKTYCPTCNYSSVTPMPGTKAVRPQEQSLFKSLQQSVFSKLLGQ